MDSMELTSQQTKDVSPKQLAALDTGSNYIPLSAGVCQKKLCSQPPRAEALTGPVLKPVTLRQKQCVLNDHHKATCAVSSLCPVYFSSPTRGRFEKNTKMETLKKPSGY